MEDKLCKRCGSKLFRKDFTTKTVYYCERCFSCETTELECEHEYELMLFKLESGSTQLRKFCRKCKQRDPHPVKQTPENTSGLAIHDEVKYKQHMEGLRKTEDVEYRPFVEVFFEKLVFRSILIKSSSVTFFTEKSITFILISFTAKSISLILFCTGTFIMLLV